MTEQSLATRDLQTVFHPATDLTAHRQRGPLVIDRGEGIHVWDTNGKRYIEGMAGLWCTALGYGVEELAEVGYQQLRKLAYSHLFAGKSHESAVMLADRLVDMVPFPASKALFGSSGSDANDTQVKLVWYYNNAIGRPRKKKIISRWRAYHGVTVASGSLTGLAANHKHFDLPIANILHTDCPHYYWEAEPGETEEEFSTRLASNLEKLILDEDPDTVAAFIAEPVMGAGGVIVPPRTYFEKIQAVLQKYDVLLIDDEVICGFGRTGNVFGAETYSMRPQTMSLAKALSSAYQPISAVLVNEPIYEAMVEGSRDVGVFGHGYTYTGHPVTAAVALKALDLYEEKRIYEHVRQVGPYFQERLRRLDENPLVGEARGVGLIGACELIKNKDAKQKFSGADGVGLHCADRCQTRGLIVRQPGDTIALCPPLIVSREDIDEIFDILRLALDDTLAWASHQGLLA
jgi:4-aminobutyrate--pyruvate transaminase